MADESYKHIFLDGPTDDSQTFTSVHKGGSGPNIPDNRDRRNHGAYLQKQFENTWRQAEEQRRAVVHTERKGTYIEFESAPGFDLAVKSLEYGPSKIKLRNVRTEGDGENKRTLATVYVPNDKRAYFLKKIEQYLTEETSTGKFKNAPLIDSVSDIRLAILESFWRQEERASIPGEASEWLELWISTEQDDAGTAVSATLESLNIEVAEGELIFPERIVRLVKANREQLEKLIESTDDIAEFRAAREVATHFIDKETSEQTLLVRELLERCRFDDSSGVAVCILDSGVNNEHDLLKPMLKKEDLHSVCEEWGTHDDRNHGTCMAGTATYGDLQNILQTDGSLQIDYFLESSKILPPPPEENPKQLWGVITSLGISRAENSNPNCKRIICSSVTALDDVARGRPSSWSGEVDALTSGYGDNIKRIIIISAGNVEGSTNWKRYHDANMTVQVEDPAQAWNALTVGSFTDKTLITHRDFSGYQPVAPAGGLSPYSSTSLTWPHKIWPIKPEVVLEGGNVARSPDDTIFDSEVLGLLSTYYKPHIRQFEGFSMTSASAALAARMAAQIQVDYPEAWPETIRALIVHSARWTDTMQRQFLPARPLKDDYAKLLRICGYGVPDLDRARRCMSNSLTLISQADMQPFDKKQSRGITRDMHLYELPWPKDALLCLGETPVSMRITLSYFIEPSPGPGEVGWGNRYRYPSHALRFDINGVRESLGEFVKRINKQARDEDEGHPGTIGASSKWKIGQARNVGSIHSDIWEGNASELATSNMIAIYPAAGWWRERLHKNCWNKRCRYSLVVSIYTPKTDVDIYLPVANELGLTVSVEV